MLGGLTVTRADASAFKIKKVPEAAVLTLYPLSHCAWETCFKPALRRGWGGGRGGNAAVMETMRTLGMTTGRLLYDIDGGAGLLMAVAVRLELVVVMSQKTQKLPPVTKPS